METSGKDLNARGPSRLTASIGGCNSAHCGLIKSTSLISSH